MRSRSALVVLLTVGALMSGIGAAQGASVLSDRTDAGAAQYGSTAPDDTVGGQTGTGERKGITASGGSTQPPTGSTSSLPFTGYAAMSLVIAGLALMLGGGLLRRFTTRADRRD